MRDEKKRVAYNSPNRLIRSHYSGTETKNLNGTIKNFVRTMTDLVRDPLPPSDSLAQKPTSTGLRPCDISKKWEQSKGGAEGSESISA